jgi:GNAT superfamily N-acetyltransferase
MSAQALAIQKQASVNLRPFDMRRDLLAVADLVELCFADSLDGDGRLYIRQMRQAARSGSLMSLASSTDVQLGGMVWEEDGKVIGNLSLIPQYFQNRRMYLIANVAVHPDHRRRGIGRALTQAALEEIKRRGHAETWLQVDEDNLTAVNLYRSMGFSERARRTSWRLDPTGESANRLAHITVRTRRAADWLRQKAWLESSYPEELRWNLLLDFGLLQPGLLGALQRSLGDRQTEQWSAELDGELLGVLSWQSSSLEADRLWLAAATDREDEAIPALINHMQGQLRPGRKLALNYPARRATATLTEAGFSAARTLIWMHFSERK